MTGWRLLAAAFLLVSCASGPPPFAPVGGPETGRVRSDCAAFFPEGVTRFVHRIEARLSGRTTVMIGVTQVDAPHRSLHCVLMTVEGLVLFEGRQNGELSILRSVAPFDNAAFAAGMMADVALMFLPPEPAAPTPGTTPQGEPFCRWQDGDTHVTDLIHHADGCRTLNRYRKGTLIRTLAADSVTPPGRMTLTAHDGPGYALTLTLISTESAADSPPAPADAKATGDAS